jgi:hypothetical protein
MRRLWLILFLLAPLWLLASDASARPGGGHSYSGGGGGSYGGGSSSYGGGSSSYGGGYSSYSSDYDSDYSGGGDLGPGGAIAAIIVIGLIVIFGLISTVNESYPNDSSWNSMPYVPPPPPPDLNQLRNLDPEFSSVLFEDFMYHLFVAAHQARIDADQLATLAPHFNKKALNKLGTREPVGKHIDRVVIGSMTVIRLSIPSSPVTYDGSPYYVNLAIRFESNMRIGEGENAQKYYVDETWYLSRAATAQSVPPERMRATLCSNCGAPFAGSEERVCSSCDEMVSDGRHGWVVTNMIVSRHESRPTSLTGYAPEVGTGDLTRFQKGLPVKLKSLHTDDPAFTQEGLKARARLIFGEMYQAWNDDEIARVRPYVSDGLFNYLRYWLQAYRHEELENWVEDYRTTKLSIAKVVRDSHFDAVTIRVWATGKDYTLNKEGAVVGGSSKKHRQFSEYWTLIRSAFFNDTATTEKKCPQCGAEQKISMAGNCEFCQAHITSGEFDWVLSKIEQDESYRG